MDKLILSFDCGTQSTRAMLFNMKGELLSKVKECYEPYFSKEEGYAEQDPDLYYKKLCEASRKLKSMNEERWGDIIGVAVTSMRDVGVCLDKERKPLRPAMIWLDRRKAACEEKLPFKSRLLFAISGMTDVVTKNRVDCKANWLRENEPDIWDATDKYVQISAYLNYLLTGNLKDSVASTIAHMPVDYKHRAWLSEKHFQYPVFNVPASKLYPLCEPGEITGQITAQAEEDSGIRRGTPVLATGSDKGCETIGTGVIKKDMASLSFGTTATIQIATEKYVEPITFLPGYPAVYPNRYNPEIMVNRGYWMLTWFIEQFVKKDGLCKCYEKELDARLHEVPVGSDGLVVLPYWGASLKYPESKGAILGFTEKHTLLHIYRAILEGINFSLMAGLKNLERKAGTKIKTLAVSGGGAQSDVVCQLTADMFGLPVVRVQTYETSGLGAAICALVGLRMYDSYDEAIENMVHIGKRFEPDNAQHARYAQIFEKLYRDCYKILQPVFYKMKKMKED